MPALYRWIPSHHVKAGGLLPNAIQQIPAGYFGVSTDGFLVKKGPFPGVRVGGEIIAPGGIKSKYGIYAGQGIEAGGPIEIGQITQGEMARARGNGDACKNGRTGLQWVYQTDRRHIV